jgi:AcrR family transcriptional regulator
MATSSRGRGNSRKRASAEPAEQGAIRGDILAAATRLFSEQGYHAASMQDIAVATGMRKASLYHHVRSKEDLLFAIHDQMIDELMGETLKIVSASTGHVEKLRQVMHGAMHLVANHPEELTVFLQERHVLEGERWKAIVAKRDMYENLVTSIIEDGEREGVFVAIDAHIATRGLLAMAFWCYTWFREGGEFTADQIADMFADVALNGLVAKPA